METENVSDRSNNIYVSIALQNVMDCYGTDQKVIRYGNIVLGSKHSLFGQFMSHYKIKKFCKIAAWKLVPDSFVFAEN